ncbi:hypothetical protein ABUO53_002372 [Salmonella enterica subsp. enterica serovar Newport]|nr:hypothetical protein [Salmonella enterica subsp. enterica serovar Newport]
MKTAITSITQHQDQVENTGSFELSVNGISNRSNSPYMVVSVSCLSALKYEVITLNIEIDRDDEKGVAYYELLAVEKAKKLLKSIATQL